MLTVQDDDAVMTLVETALAKPPEERQAWLATTCAQDTELYEVVWKYVGWEQRMQDFLREPLLPSAPVERPFAPDQLLEARFRIVREVARGGMGIVYEAVDEKLERRIALKCAKAGYRKRLPPEVRNASEISHPNVCKIFEIHTASTRQGNIDFLTMEFLEGETLAARIRRGALPEEEARTIAVQLCSGLAEAHHRQVIHGDLKSNNVILTSDTDGQVRAVITDFGLARRPQALQGAEQSGETAGTPDYMAPELWQGAKASVASDIYALGVMLEELASGKRAPTREERLAGSQRAVHTKWAPVIQRCLDPDPARRFRDADDVAQALQPRSRRWFAGVAAAAVLAVASGLVTYQTATAPQETVRLAVLPFTPGAEMESVATDLSRRAAEQVRRLNGTARTRLITIPLNRTLRMRTQTVENARAVLGATHVLHGTVKREDDRIVLQVFLTDARSGVNAKEWKLTYRSGDTRYAAVAMAGMVTATFRLPALTDEASVNTAARQNYRAGVQYLRHNTTVDQGLPLLERAVAADPDSPLTHAALAEGQWRKYVMTNDQVWLQRATESVRQAERRNPDLAEVHRVAGLLDANAGWHQRAEAHYLRAVELDPNNSDALRRLGIIYDALNEREKALAAYRRAVELEPEYYRNHQDLGTYYKERADYREALRHFRRMIELAPNEPVAHFALGTTYMSLGQFEEAERALRHALDLGETPTALNTLGAVLMYQRRDQEAIVYISRALNTYPEKYLWWMNLGTAYRRLNLLTDAERANRRGLELAEAEMSRNPKNGYVRACLAYLCAWLGDRRRADAEIAQALQLSPNDSDARRMAVKTYEALKKREESLVVLNDSAPDVITDISRFPDLADLHADPRFKTMLAAARNKESI